MIGGSQSQGTGLKGKLHDVPAFMTAILRNLAADNTAKHGYRGRTDSSKGVMSKRWGGVPIRRTASGPE